MTIPSMTTVDRLRQIVAETIQIDVESLQGAIGCLVVATSAEHPEAPADARSVRDAAAGVTVLLADRIPAGDEAKALASEIARQHGRGPAETVLGEQAEELLGIDGKLTSNQYEVEFANRNGTPTKTTIDAGTEFEARKSVSRRPDFDSIIACRKMPNYTRQQLARIGELDAASRRGMQGNVANLNEQVAPATKLVEVRLSALTRVEYMEVVEVPANITQAELDDLVNARYRQVDGGEFTSDPEYWERGTCEAVDSDLPDATPTMVAFRTDKGLHVERADAASQTADCSGPTP